MSSGNAPSFAVHRDILQMAQSEEKRERIKWFHALHVFFARDENACANGLGLARLCKHEDARFLVSLFPSGASPTKGEARAVFLSHDDARCNAWAVACVGEATLSNRLELKQLVKRSAEGGCAWGQWMCASQAQGREEVMWLEKADAQGFAEAMRSLAHCLQDAEDATDEDRLRARRLWREAALLGLVEAQYEYAQEYCAKQSIEWFVWMRRCAERGVRICLRDLLLYSPQQLYVYQNCGAVRALLEIGRAMAAHPDWREEVSQANVVVASVKALSLYEQCCALAKTGVMCWLWVARQFTVVKDVRLMIADLIWYERVAWSERGRLG